MKALSQGDQRVRCPPPPEDGMCLHDFRPWLGCFPLEGLWSFPVAEAHGSLLWRSQCRRQYDPCEVPSVSRECVRMPSPDGSLAITLPSSQGPWKAQQEPMHLKKLRGLADGMNDILFTLCFFVSKLHGFMNQGRNGCFAFFFFVLSAGFHS